LLLWAIALFAFAGMVVFFWPGVGTYEVMQFAQQRKLPVMNDWKSPFVAGIYWFSDDFFNSTGPVLLAQQALFWSGLALIALNPLKSAYSRIIFFYWSQSFQPYGSLKFYFGKKRGPFLAFQLVSAQLLRI
jgi:hypothetical protein